MKSHVNSPRTKLQTNPKRRGGRPAAHSGCVFPHCNGAHRTRGLCANHYQIALGLIAGKRISWASLEKRQLALPKLATAAEIFLGTRHA